MSDAQTQIEPQEPGERPPLPRGQARGPSTGPGRGLSRREFLALGASAGAAAALAACQPTTTPAPAGTTPSGPATAPAAPAKKLAESVMLAAQSINDSLDPHGTLSNSGFMMARQIYDALVTFDEKGEKIVPQLATEWKRIDPTTMEFKLRDDVKFSNGEGFTAETVKFSVERLINSTDPLHSGTKLRMVTIAGAEVVNSTTVRIKTKVPDPILLNRLSMLFMAPQKYTEGGADLKTKGIGTGSFKVTNFQTAKEIALEAFEGTWRGKSPIKTAKILAISEVAALVAALKTGEIDIAWNVQGDQVPSLRNDFNVGAQPAGSCTISSLIPLTPAFADKRVRQAINLAVNKEELIKTVIGGFGRIPTGQLLQPGMLGYDDSLKAFPYDPEKAKSLLKEAGFASLDASIATTASTKAIAEAVSGYLRAVGINLKVNVLEFPVFVVNLTQQTDHPMMTWNTDYFHIRDFDAVTPRFTTQKQLHFDNEEFRKLYETSRSELDPDKRSAIVKQLAKIMYDEAALLFLAWRDFAVVYNKKIANLALPYDTSIYLWKVEKAA